MRLSFLLTIALFFRFSSINASGDSVSFKSVWADFVSIDDNEKNFKFVETMSQLESLAIHFTKHNIESYLPETWSHIVSADSSMVFMAGLLPYRMQQGRLVWILLRPEDEKKPARLFNHLLEVPVQHFFRPEVSSTQFAIADNVFTSFVIKLGTQELVSFPDVDVKLLFDQLVQTENDRHKEALSNEIWERLSVLLNQKELFSNPFKGYERMSTLLSPDGVVKVCTWNIEYTNGDNAFFGGIAVHLNGNVRVHQLNDSYRSIRSPEQANLTASRWYGCVYYELLENRYRGDTFYTLLGYNGNTAFSKIRVVEALAIAANGIPRFASAIFTDERRSRRRLIFEYSNRANMMLRYDDGMRMIVMDNLAPIDNMFENDFRYYGPDFSYNGLRFERGKWVWYDDIDLRNPAPPRRSR